MSEKIPAALRYSKEHEWAKEDGDVLVIGITEHAQAQLGDVVFLELPDAGRVLAKDEAFGVVESVKAVSDLYAPLAGEVVESNTELVDSPERVNEDPYGAAWMIRLKPSDPGAFATLMDAATYQKFLESEA